MGLISGAIDSVLESIGTSMLNGGEWFIQAGYKMWQQCSSITLTYVERNPMSQASAWGIVTGGFITRAQGLALLSLGPCYEQWTLKTPAAAENLTWLGAEAMTPEEIAGVREKAGPEQEAFQREFARKLTGLLERD